MTVNQPCACGCHPVQVQRRLFPSFANFPVLHAATQQSMLAARKVAMETYDHRNLVLAYRFACYSLTYLRQHGEGSEAAVKELVSVKERLATLIVRDYLEWLFA